MCQLLVDRRDFICEIQVFEGGVVVKCWLFVGDRVALLSGSSSHMQMNL